MCSLLTPYHFLCLLLFFFLNFQPLLSSSSSSSGTHLCSHHEAAALIHFKNSFSITDIFSEDCYESYPKTNSWKEGTDCCSWDGVTCDHVNGHVIGLDLSCSWLYGSLPSNNSLFLLPHLQKLNLAFNYFNHSKMSSKFGRFASLVYLNLSRSFFEGHVPSQVSHLSKLVSLDLSSYRGQTLDKHTLEGLVHNLTELRQLFLDGINMSSINPNVLMNLSSSLRSLSLNDCDLRGKFPKSIFHLPNLELLNLGDNENLSLVLLKFNRSSNLEDLDLSYSNLSGSIPRSLGNLLQLIHLDLSYNHLTGELPSSLTNLTQLEELYIGGNSLEGSIPDEVTAFSNLISLDLSSNLLNGTLPSWLSTVPSLMYIDLSHNQFSGHIKEFQSKSLQYIHLGYNKLQGPVPSSIFQLANLTYLYLSSNNLSGVVEFGMFSKLQNLQFLDLSYNSLSLNSNSTASADYTLPNLQGLFLSSCNVNEFPQFLRGSKSLLQLDLSYNKIYGKIPKWMWDVGKDSMFYFNVSHNSLTEVEQLPRKSVSLSGEVSSLICNATTLRILDLSHNNLSGIIPPCFGNLSKSLSFLNLRKNKLYGIIPPTFADGCRLSNLNLNGNQLEGPLPPSIINCTGLQVLDLGNNKFNDTFPNWLGSLPLLQILVLRSNRFHGSIHDTGSNLSFSEIQIFDLSSNYFSGPLPVRYIKSFKAMINLTKDESAMPYMGMEMGDATYDNAFEMANSDGFYSYSTGIVIKGQERELVKIFTMWTTIDLSNNKFHGEIPLVIGKLNSLKGLNLSHNNLSGCIPTSIGNLTSLEWLDLSSNKLTGTIPERLADLTFLSFLNVSENQLGGRIPQGKQFNTFGNDSYEGNKGLCGFPVSKGCSINEPPPSNLLEDDGSKSNIAFGWKVVLIGYGCGVVFGLAVGYVVFQTGKPKWFVKLVEDQHQKRRRKSKIGNRRSGGRRRI